MYRYVGIDGKRNSIEPHTEVTENKKRTEFSRLEEKLSNIG